MSTPISIEVTQEQVFEALDYLKTSVVLREISKSHRCSEYKGDQEIANLLDNMVVWIQRIESREDFGYNSRIAV